VDAVPLKHVLRFILEIGNNIIKGLMLILFIDAGTTQTWAVLLLFGGNNASIFRIKVGGLCKWLIYIGRQCSRLRNMSWN